MRFLKPDELTPEHLTALSKPRELSPEEKAEVVRLYLAEITEAELQEYAQWQDATPVEDFLRELEEEQKRCDEQHP